MGQIIKLHHVVDAKHVRNIGEQSVSSNIQAINELVKNAYDADATWCKVHFYAKTPFDGYLDIYKIVIEDSGVGMTFDDIKNKWMRLATDTKERESLSPKFHRRVSGEKGMGHFATQKLGNLIKITSNPEMYRKREPSKYSDKTLVLNTNWSRYVPGKDFEDIEDDLEVLDRDPNAGYGVMIEITELKEPPWTLEDIENVRLNLGSLQAPKLLQKNTSHPFEPHLITHGFELENEEVESGIEKFAPWLIKCSLRGNTGYFTVFTRDDKTGKRRIASDISKRAKAKSKFQVEGESFGDASFILYYYVGRVADWAPKTVRNRKLLQDQLDENYGIKIFNDGIRIMPYGNPGNDWLGLGERKIARAGGKIRNEQSIGYVLLSREKNSKIIETTTRQALIENKAFEGLKKFVLKTIEEFETYLSEYKEDQSYSEVKEDPKSKAASEIIQLTEFVESLPLEEDTKKAQVTKLNKISSLMEQQELKAEEEVEKVTTNLEMYRNLASLGISALAFHHEILQRLGRIESRQQMLMDKWKNWDDKKKIDYITKTLADTYEIEDLNTYVREFAALFMGTKGTKRRREEIELKKSLENMKEGFENILKSQGVEIVIEQGPGSFSGLYMNKASFESIMLNLVSNSMRALNRVDRTKKVIKIMYEKTSTLLKIWVSDNGCGIEEENFERIFDPFWTTYKAQHEMGTGMGTTIVREILRDDYGGDVVVNSSVFEEKNPGKGETTFLITMPLENLKKRG